MLALLRPSPKQTDAQDCVAWLRVSQKPCEFIKLRQCYPEKAPNAQLRKCLVQQTVDDPRALRSVRVRELEQADRRVVMLLHIIPKSSKNIIKRAIERKFRQLTALRQVFAAAAAYGRPITSTSERVPGPHGTSHPYMGIYWRRRGVERVRWERGQYVARCSPGTTSHFLVQWSEDVIKADPCLGRSPVRFQVPPLGFEHNCT